MPDIKMEVRGLEELQHKKEQMVRDLHGTPMLNAMRSATLLVTRDAKSNAPVFTGRLRSSITPDVRIEGRVDVVGVVGSNVFYACIFDAHTNIITDKGYKSIGQIQVGDYVLSQDGYYHRVNGKTSFPATEKPQLVTLQVQWRSDRCHTLNLTVDHKVLVYRNHRNIWIEAGKLQPGDLLFGRKKIPHNKGVSKYKPHICPVCGKSFIYSQNGKNRLQVYCSWECKQIDWNINQNNPHIGTKRSKITRQRISKATTIRLEAHPETHPNHILRRTRRTEYEQKLIQWFEDQSIDHEIQYRVGRYYVDVFVPQSNTFYEADGAFWHQDQEIDIERDKAILEQIPDARIVHIHFYDKRHSPHLNPNPLPNVYYCAVNPGMKSYVDLALFETREVLSVKHWKYEQSGDKPALLYDLSVEDVHSFFANGILVSNSYMELGTGIPAGNPKVHWPPAAALEVWANRHGTTGFLVARAIGRRGGLKPRKFLQKAFDQNREKIIELIGNGVSKIVRK